MSEYNSKFTGAEIDEGIERARGVQQKTFSSGRGTVMEAGRIQFDNAFFVSAGFVYLLSCAYDDDSRKAFAEAGAYCPYVLDGSMQLQLRGTTDVNFDFIVTKIPTTNGEGDVYTVSPFWVDVPALTAQLTPKTKVLAAGSRTIPAGRMVGDVDGDGAVTEADRQLILKAATGSVTMTDLQSQCADTNGSGGVDVQDAAIPGEYIDGTRRLGSFARDVLGNWTVNPDYAADEAQYYIDVAVSGMTADKELMVGLSGAGADRILRLERQNGSLRFYASALPIEPIVFKVVE